MTITAAPITITRRNAAVSASAYAVVDTPGTWACTYPTGITGPATVKDPGEGARVWGNMGAGGDYLARIGAEGTDREDVTWLFEIDWDKISGTKSGASANTSAIIPLIGSFRYDVVDRVNWLIAARIYQASRGVLYLDSLSNISNTSAAAALGIAGALPSGSERWAITKATGGTYYIYQASRASSATGTRNSTGTMGGSEALVWQSGVSCSKILRVCDNAELDAWFANGTIPATDREFVFPGGQEINSSAPVIYDVSGNVTPLDLTAAQVTGWQAPGMSVATTDTDFTSPLVEIPLTIAADCAAGVHDITLRRTRVGIPARVPALSDAVLYDDGTIPITVAVTAEAVTIGPDTTLQVPSYPATFGLILSGNYDGAATVVSDDAHLIPESPVTISGGVAVVACIVSADVSGATVTATGPGGDTDACSVTVTEQPEDVVPLTIGPSQSLRTSVTSVYLRITGENGAVQVASSPAFGLSGLPATVIVTGNKYDLALVKMTPGTYTITVTQGVASASCTVTIAAPGTSSTSDDLLYDVAMLIEAFPQDSGNAYHYDETVTTPEVIGLEDRSFYLKPLGMLDGPLNGGKTALVEVQVVSQVRTNPVDQRELIDYINQDVEWPDYVAAGYIKLSASDDSGYPLTIYQLEIVLK